ncbi:MAG: phosphoglycerate mutase family protein [Cyclobacteriaceae bacterium]
MRKLVIAFVLLLAVQAGYAQQITTFILVRHAEKATEGGSDPELKPEGVKRAEALAALFDKTKIDAIYSTDFKRTKNTVAPLAAAKGLTVNTYSSMKAADLEKLVAAHPGGTIVISGHSNTIPDIANALTGGKDFKQFADADYGNILIVSVTALGKDAKVVWLRY